MTRIVAFDTETRGLNWFDPDERAFLASWADESAEYVADLSDPAQVGQFLQAVEGADILVCHNLSFDVHQVRATLDWDALQSGATLHDTDLMSRVMFPEGQRKGERGGHGLKNLASVYLRADADQAEKHISQLADSMGFKLKSTGGYYDTWRAYPGPMEKYARLDARYTYDLFVKFWSKMTDDQRAVYELEMAVAPILIRAEQHGVAVDQDVVLGLRKDYYEQQAKVREYLETELGEQALGGEGSEEAMIEALLGLGVPLYRKTDSGKLSTNKFALQEFADDFPQIAALQEFRQLDRFLTTYLAPMVGRDVVHPSFMQCGAWTGRMSCRRPNMQNIPRGEGPRSALVPRDGHSFVVVDYDSIEVRLLAHYLGDPGFRALIEDGHDPHAWMASNIHGGEPADYHKGTDGESIRASAKNTLFAITYGAGGPRVADMNKIKIEEARALIAKIKSSLPNYSRLNKRIRSKVERLGYVNTLWGRKQPVNKDKAYVGLNALIQGSAADIMKQGLVNVDAAVKDLGGVPLMVVHDEVVVEVPTENADEALRVTEQALRGAYDLSPSLAVTGAVVQSNYAEAK